jgi:hypothetical protein
MHVMHVHLKYVQLRAVTPSTDPRPNPFGDERKSESEN